MNKTKKKKKGKETEAKQLVQNSHSFAKAEQIENTALKTFPFAQAHSVLSRTMWLLVIWKTSKLA